MFETGLSKFPIFKGFTPEQIREILDSSELREVNQGDVLIEPGQPNTTLYLVVKGELQIVLEKDEGQVSIPIQTGECLGEMSIVMGEPTSALAIAHLPSLILCIPEHSFWDQIMMNPQGGRNLLRMMASRLTRANLALMKRVKEQLRYQHIEKELETAGKIQSSIVPDGTRLLPNSPEVEAFAIMDQAREVGGDFFDAIALDDEHVFLAIGDVSGKGMPASLFMTRTFTSLRMLISNNPEFKDVIPSLNDMLVRKNKDMMFVSIFAGVLNVRTGVLRYVNGGHNPPFASRNGKEYLPLDVKIAPLVGILEQAQFPITTLQLHPGDSLVLYTDGIPEAMNEESQMFEMDQIQQVLNRHKSNSMQALVQLLEEAVENFVGEAPQHDDFTALAIRYLG